MAQQSKPQTDQQKLLAEALKQPGVAATIAAYGKLERFLPAITAPMTRSTYATGGNTR